MILLLTKSIYLWKLEFIGNLLFIRSVIRAVAALSIINGFDGAIEEFINGAPDSDKIQGIHFDFIINMSPLFNGYVEKEVRLAILLLSCFAAYGRRVYNTQNERYLLCRLCSYYYNKSIYSISNKFSKRIN